MSYTKRTNTRVARGEETMADVLHGSSSKSRSLLNVVVACVISFSLVLAFTPIMLVGTAFANPEEGTDTPGVTGANTITVTYKVENGSWNDGSTDSVVHNVAPLLTGDQPDPDGTVTLPTAPAVGDKPAQNYKVGKWNTDDGTLPTTISAAGASGGAITYTYTYAAKAKYTVTFDTDGGSAVARQEVYEGDTVTKPTNPTKDGYTFAGWQQNGADYNFSNPVADNITLTAKWTPVSTPDPEEHVITITYKVEYGSWNDGDAQPKSQTLTLVGDASGTLTPPAVGNAPTTNYKAGKWNTKSGELPATITYADTIDGKITYIYSYAQKELFTVTFDSDGGSPVQSQQVYEGDFATEPANPIKAGMSFSYWVTADGAVYKFKTTPVVGDITLKAIWMPTTGQWKSNAIGKWYEYGDGNYVKNAWLSDNGKKYHFNDGGYMQTGWQRVAAPGSDQVNWYFFESSGAMATGWKNLGGVWYYLDTTDGTMCEDGQYTIAGKKYYFNGSGAMMTGWVNSGTKQAPIWNYYDPSGAMATGWKNLGGVWYYLDTTTGVMYEDGQYPISGKTYCFNSSGAMMTGWVNSGTEQAPVWRYFEPSGAMAQGWAVVGSIWYYLNPESGIMAIGAQSIGDKEYFFASNGAMITGWRNVSSNGATNWYYYNASGAMVIDDWALVGGVWYYMGADGIMYRGGQYPIAGKTYCFNDSGAMMTGWVNAGSANAPVWYFYGPSGAMLIDAWVGDYWLGADGKMATNEWVDNGKYYVGPDGKWDSSKKPADNPDSK